jgi:hypothetical protein
LGTCVNLSCKKFYDFEPWFGIHKTKSYCQNYKMGALVAKNQLEI